MKEFQNIGKRMPYQESGEYVSQLISRSTEQAISESRKAQHRPIRQWMAAAAVSVVLLAGAGITLFHTADDETIASAETAISPIDQFLDGLTDDEAQMLAYYEIEEIPEYE